MEGSVILMCKRGVLSAGVVLSQHATFQDLVEKLCRKWSHLKGGALLLLYSLEGHAKCMLSCDDDLEALFALTLSRRIDAIDVILMDSRSSSTCSTVDPCSSDGGSIASLGQRFNDGAVEFCDCLTKYSVFHGFQFYYYKNHKDKVNAYCVERPDGRCGCHFIGRLVTEELRSRPFKRAIEIMHDVKEDYGVGVTYCRSHMGLQKAKDCAFGSYSASFADLKCFGACKYGFNYCRPLLFLDDTFLKSMYEGSLLSACTKDGNQDASVAVSYDSSLPLWGKFHPVAYRLDYCPPGKKTELVTQAA
ncbi:hypothetical protein RHGRI_013939 [Rhododendron griersonianum]|uniref:PB1 domain-containing protein n=1 Tax=Rhododendron griersonianum TaxID=479676 RepID=A0AAV6K7I2_9ERIC|nr:hypothetical protein RHGRI_013939 [Rhododendron griersonianum]